MQKIGPKDLFLQVLGWKKYILCLWRETGVIFLKFHHAKPLTTVAADSARVQNVKILMWVSMMRLSISWYDQLFITRNALLLFVVHFLLRKFYIQIEDKKNPYSYKVWGVEWQWLHGNSLATKKVSNSWIGIVSDAKKTKAGKSWAPMIIHLVTNSNQLQEGGGAWKIDQHSQFFFVDLADPLPPSLPNIVCFPSSNVFFGCFFVISIYFFSQFIYWYLLSISSPTYEAHIILKSVLCMNLYLEEHMSEITESGEFCDIHCCLWYYCWHWCI